MKKRLVSWLLAVCMVVSLLPSVVLADNSAWTTWTTADSTHVQVETPASYIATEMKGKNSKLIHFIRYDLPGLPPGRRANEACIFGAAMLY